MDTIITVYPLREKDIRFVRDEVFIVEQSVSREEEFDDRDNHCIHAVTYVNGAPVGTGRIDLEKNGKIGRVAVLKAHRRRGIGRMIMHALESYAKDKGLTRLWFHAQVQAVPFYSNLGYRISGGEFIEADIPHVKMEKGI